MRDIGALQDYYRQDHTNLTRLSRIDLGHLHCGRLRLEEVSGFPQYKLPDAHLGVCLGKVYLI